LRVSGAEPSTVAVANAPQSVRAFIKSPDDELASSTSYDIISMFHVLEHVSKPAELLIRLIEKLNPGGHLVIALPNPSSSDAKHYKAHWAGWDVPRHLWHYEPDQIIAMAQRLGVQHVNSRPMWFDAFYVSLLSERYKKGNPISGLFHASISNLKALGASKRHCSSQIYIFKRI